ncbi:MAG: D-alanyl-D-alanine carboxypeptidase [Firmicutes bacterium]|nr:D-alanyl-D-alanine carboxypeptidase [Bacillota bacterium]
MLGKNQSANPDIFKITMSFILTVVLTLGVIHISHAEEVPALSVDGKSAVLIEPTSGEVLFEQNPHEKLAPASVTKIMTLLLIYESVENGKIKWEDKVTVSEHAASMGGSQIFLEPNEQQSVKDLTKSIAIASANDAAVARSEFIGGSDENFVKMMNEKAAALGMNDTHFENACGLDADNHYMSSYDIALMSRELLNKYPEIQEYTTKWQDTITHTTKKGETEFGLTNTNKLIKQYNGTIGLKTGSTGKALYCLSGAAQRDGMTLIAVIMAAPDPKVRFREVAKMLDYGFSNYTVIKGDTKSTPLAQINVYKGKEDTVNGVLADEVTATVKKGEQAELTKKIETNEGIAAPFEQGTKVGEVIYYYKDREVGRSDIVTEKAVEKADLLEIIGKLFMKWFE